MGLVNGSGSNFQITRLAAKYNEMQQSGVLLSNRKSMDVVRARLEELLERVDAREYSERVIALYNLWTKWKEQDSHGKQVEALQTVMEIDKEFEKAYHDYRSWDQILNLIDLDRKLVESEVKIAKDLHAVMTAEEAYEMIAQFFGIIIRHVNDPLALKAIQYELTRLIGDRSNVEVEASDGEEGT
jgi:flagellin-specific chaperone FliS